MSFNSIYRALLPRSRLTRVPQGFSLIKSKELSSRVHDEDACGRGGNLVSIREIKYLENNSDWALSDQAWKKTLVSGKTKL